MRVYAVSPGFMPGGLNGDLPRPVLDFLSSKGKEMNIASPEEVAGLIMELARPETAERIPGGVSITVPERKITAL